jgi:hypothetical protein
MRLSKVNFFKGGKMKVSELIVWLQSQPQDAEVLTLRAVSKTRGMQTWTEVYEEPLDIDRHVEWWHEGKILIGYDES